jgi:spore coat polysaccharide biosynthesis protein SpsF
MSDFYKIQKSGAARNLSGRGTVMAFLQARMGSHRLPGKVLMRIHGQSILERAIRRLWAAVGIDEVVVLTTCRNEDDAIVETCSRIGALVYRGPDEDVLLRFHEASMKFKPEIIIRATADNPLIDIGSIERIIAALRSNDVDLCVEAELPYGAATEAITAIALDRVHSLALDPRHREHVTLYAWEHPDEFRLSRIIAPASVRYPEIRVTVDTLEDFQHVEQMIGRVIEDEVPMPLQAYLAKALDGKMR